MSIKTNELQQLNAPQGVDSILLDSLTAGTGRLSLSSLAQFLTEQDNAVKTALSNKVSKTLRADIYIAKNGNDVTGDGSEAKPYLTIKKAINSIGYILDLPVVVHIGAGTYDEEVVIYGISGSTVNINCAQNEDGTPAVRVASLSVYSCNVFVWIKNMEVYGQNNANAAVYIAHTASTFLNNVVCKTAPVNTGGNNGAIYVHDSGRVCIHNCTIANQTCAVHAVGSIVYLNVGTTGQNNTVSLRSGSGMGCYGGIIIKGNSTISGATEIKEYGGQIF
mgnify:CR=1 FL=1